MSDNKGRSSRLSTWVSVLLMVGIGCFAVAATLGKIEWELAFKIALEFVKVAAWPILIGWVVYQFRSQLQELIKLTANVKAFGVEWNRQAKEVRDEAALLESIQGVVEVHEAPDTVEATGGATLDNVIGTATGTVASSEEDIDDLLPHKDLKRSNVIYSAAIRNPSSRPSAIVFDAWNDVERAIIHLGKRSAINIAYGPTGALDVDRTVQRLTMKGAVDSRAARVIERLQAMVNAVRNEPRLEPDKEAVVEFADSAAFVAASLRSAAG